MNTVPSTFQSTDELDVSKLPDKLSDLLRLALADLKACEEDPNYGVSMYLWHARPTADNIGFDSSRCHVCLAGAVLAKTLHLDPGVTIPTLNADAHKTSRLYAAMVALDRLRTGHVRSAALIWREHVRNSTPDKLDALLEAPTPAEVEAQLEGLGERVYVAPYGSDARRFHEDMLFVLEVLEKQGL